MTAWGECTTVNPPGRKRFLGKGVNRKENRPLGEHTPCTYFHFKGEKRPWRMKGRGAVLPNNLCHRLGPGFASTAGKQHRTWDELFSDF